MDKNSGLCNRDLAIIGGWQRPSVGNVKINVDAAFVFNSKSSCSGVVARDSSGCPSR